VAEGGVVQAEAARRPDVTQPRPNDLARGRISNFGRAAFTVLAARAGLEVHLQAVRAAA
jgi:predicted XRE-type DNA-binding protein